MTETKRYLANPDVSCRPEGPDDGAILFNPDTDAVIVINPVGLLIWEALGQPKTQDEIAAYLMEACEDVPADQVHADLEAFFGALQPGGFVGEVLEGEA
ncbi:MAG: PqqD family peptide modification chaperone [Chloroflexi bacterium]|nr:PqqD family peptide modification chaperone [Chloroflexota bacterium]MBU1748023.1 PqqD family peptide modification chaperone [Chloroflexota bacterium]